MDTDKLPFYLRQLTNSLENKLADKLKDRDKDSDDDRDDSPMPPMVAGGALYEPDWDDLDKKANLIIIRYTVVNTAANVLPFGLDIVAVTFAFTKMTTELAGVYQVIVSNKRARQMGWAIATTTGTVLGAAYAASKLASFIPGGYFFGVLFQAPIVGAVAWAAGDTLKGYFKETRRGREPGLDGLRDSFAKTLHLKLKSVKADKATKSGVASTAAAAAPTAPVAATAEPSLSTNDIVDKIAGLHELMRVGAITQAEYDKTKAELLRKM